MNLLLFRERELERNVGWVRGERAEHIRSVLKKGVGDILKVGVDRRGRGSGTIVSDTSEGLAIEIGELTPSEPPVVHLIVALPRPLALSRLLHTLASFGTLHVDLIRAWKVPRSYFSSPRLEPERLELDLQLGAEQGGQTFIPTFKVHDGFRRFVEDELPPSPFLAAPGARFILEPETPHFFPKNAGGLARTSLAFGPEGGFIPDELATFSRIGFEPICLGAAILTTEIAVAASLAQLTYLRGESLN
jgi:16S rRNA (uracil1498-N3)-methyltransferase